MDGNTVIRRANFADASSLAALSIEVWFGTYIREGINSFFADHALREFTAERLHDRLADQSRTILVSQNVVGIDGMIELKAGSLPPVDGCPDTEIATLYVQPRHQGSGNVIALLRAGLEHAQADGHNGVWLAVNAENIAAIAFYERQAFDRAGDTHYQIGNQFYLNHILRRDF